MAERVGFIGLGSMGFPIAHNLLKAGYELHVYNRDGRKAETLLVDGAQQGRCPAEVTETGGIIMTMVSDDAALEQITLGQDGLLERLGPGGVHISMSTISPTLARHMASLHAEKDCAYIAAPVFGRPEAAEAQKLWVCVAGAGAAKERVQPLLQSIGQGMYDFGEDPGNANVVKLCGNFMVASAMEAMAEALTLAEKNGVDRCSVMSMFGQTAFACPVYQNYGKAIAERRFTPGFQMRLGLKDLNLVLGAAEDAKVPMPFASLVHDRLLSGIARGKGTADWPAFTLLVSEDAGL